MSAISPILSTRRNARGASADAKSILQRAIHKTANWNDPGMSVPDASFLAFPFLPDAHFVGATADSAIVFDSLFGSPYELLSLV
jgi:hypothetical protein